MTYKEAMALVKRLGGWREVEMIRFPSVWAKEQFEKAIEAKQGK